MVVFLVKTSTLASLIKLIILLLVFILILAAAYWFTRWYAKSGLAGSRKGGNIEVKETFQMSPGKQIIIVRIGSRYLALSSCKESIQVLAELSEEELDFTEKPVKDVSFKEVFSNMLSENFRKAPGRSGTGGKQKDGDE